MLARTLLGSTRVHSSTTKGSLVAHLAGASVDNARSRSREGIGCSGAQWHNGKKAARSHEMHRALFRNLERNANPIFPVYIICSIFQYTLAGFPVDPID